MNLGEVGKKGEDMVTAFLRKKGYTILKRNYSCRFGEIDIIAQKNNLLLFVEVKTRKQNALVGAAEAVDVHKQNRIILSSQDYIAKSSSHQLQPRFDIAEVTVFQRKDGTNGYNLNYIKNAF